MGRRGTPSAPGAKSQLHLLLLAAAGKGSGNGLSAALSENALIVQSGPPAGAPQQLLLAGTESGSGNAVGATGQAVEMLQGIQQVQHPVPRRSGSPVSTGSAAAKRRIGVRRLRLQMQAGARAPASAPSVVGSVASVSTAIALPAVEGREAAAGTAIEWHQLQRGASGVAKIQVRLYAALCLHYFQLNMPPVPAALWLHCAGLNLQPAVLHWFARVDCCLCGCIALEYNCHACWIVCLVVLSDGQPQSLCPCME